MRRIALHLAFTVPYESSRFCCILTLGMQTVVSTNPLAASMSSENFHDPWAFDPKRWMDTKNNDILDASQPFSLGSRICMGQRCAYPKLHMLRNLTDTGPNRTALVGWKCAQFWRRCTTSMTWN